MDDNIKDVGFAIVTPHEDLIEDNALDKFDRELTSEDWDTLNGDISKLEGNAFKYLEEKIHSVRDEGHDENDLVGTAWYDTDNSDMVDFIMGNSLQAENTEHEYDPRGVFYEGLSEIGKDLLADTVRFEFFDISDEDYEAWEDVQ